MKLIILEPGHFHASLVQREMYPAISPRAAVFARLGPEVLDYLNRVSLFNLRRENPTSWELDAHLSGDPMAEMLREPPGNIVVITGRNRGKIDRILASLSAGQHVLADKPWIIEANEMPKLEEALALADRKHLAAYDIMTERYEVTSELQRGFVNDAAVFGRMEAGTASEPGVVARSIHHVMKIVAGVPLRRPAWFFDIAEYGDGLADVGTHVVDLVQWTAFPDQALDYRRDVRVLERKRWPLALTPAQYRQVTGEEPPHAGNFDYQCNNSVHYTLRGVQVKLEILWNWEAPEGSGDVYEASFRGTLARVEIRQGAAEKNVPELYIVPRHTGVADAVRQRVAALQTRWPGLQAIESGGEFRIGVPEKFRVGHESHFAQVANHFFQYVRSPGSMPPWERSYMLAKYAVSAGPAA
jgi:predicted dehydrogenase